MSAPPQPTIKDVEMFVAVINNMKNKPEVDWDAVAQALSLKSANVASTRFQQIKKKLSLAQGVTNSAGSTPAKTPAKNPRNRAKASGSGTPSKVIKSTGGRKKKVKVEKEEEFDVDAPDAAGQDCEDMQVGGPVKNELSEEDMDDEDYTSQALHSQFEADGSFENDLVDDLLARHNQYDNYDNEA